MDDRAVEVAGTACMVRRRDNHAVPFVYKEISTREEETPCSPTGSKHNQSSVR